jgi:hypothetical protein
MTCYLICNIRIGEATIRHRRKDLLVLEELIRLGSKFSLADFYRNRKTDKMIKSHRRPDYTNQAYGLCMCIYLPQKVSNQINTLTDSYL